GSLAVLRGCLSHCVPLILRSMPLSRLLKGFCTLVRSGDCVLKKYCTSATVQRWMRLGLPTLACPAPSLPTEPIVGSIRLPGARMTPFPLSRHSNVRSRDLRSVLHQ